MPNLFSKLYYVEPSPVARRLLWHVLSIGSVSRDEPEHHAGFDKPGAHLFWIVSGKGTMQTGNRIYTLETGPRCWLVDLRKPRDYFPAAGSQHTTAGFRFGGLGIESWQEMLGEERAFVFDEADDFKAILHAQRELLLLVTRRPAGYEWQVHEIINQVLGKLLKARKIFSGSQSEVPDPVTRAVNAILANPARDWKAKELAAIARVSYSGLRRFFKGTQQESIHQFIQRTRLDQARMLLANRRLSVKEVAEQLNFSSEYYFSHFFRRTAGLSPTQFSQSLGKKSAPTSGSK